VILKLECLFYHNIYYFILFYIRRAILTQTNPKKVLIKKTAHQLLWKKQRLHSGWSISGESKSSADGSYMFDNCWVFSTIHLVVIAGGVSSSAPSSGGCAVVKYSPTCSAPMSNTYLPFPFGYKHNNIKLKKNTYVLRSKTDQYQKIKKL